MKQITLIILLLGAIALLPAALLWEEVVPIRQGVNIEWFRTGTATADGGAIYVWSDTKLGERDLWAQKVDASGNLLWNEPVLIDGKPDRQEDPVITQTTDGNYIIAWIDFYDDLDGNVYAQKINDMGQLLWQEGGKPVCTYPGIQVGLNMENDPNGGALIIWGDSRNPSKDLYAQRISSTGDPLWTTNGIAVANGSGDEIQNTMLPDGQGGMMLAYTHTFVGDSDIYAKHFDGDGNMTWNEPLSLAVTTGNQMGVRMAAIGNQEFMFTWTDQRNNDPDIYAQKVNIAGEMLWSDPFYVFSDQDISLPKPQQNPRIQATSDGAAVIVWEESLESDLFAQKISATGDKLWGESGIALCTAEFSQNGQRMDSDGNGGVYVVWDDLRNGNDPNFDIYAQHLSSTGEALWDEGGKAICTQPNAQNGGLIKLAGNNVYVNWMDQRNGSIGLYYQVLDTTGNTLLANDGLRIFWGLSGDTTKGEYRILPRSNDSIVIWQDTRFANEGYRIFFQFLTADGQTLLETNGRTLTEDGLGHQYDVHAVVTEDDHVAVVWRDERSGESQVFAQLISPAGERLWDANGLPLTESEPLSQLNPRISMYNNSFYVGWSEWEYEMMNMAFRYHVFGQRLDMNGQRLWGPDGKMISVLIGSNRNIETKLTDIIDDVYIWHRFNPSTDRQTVWAKRVDANGDAYTGWTAEGMQVNTYTGMEAQLSPVSAKTPDGIYVTWRDMRNGPMQFYAQLVSWDGEYLWAPEGIKISDSENEQEFANIAVAHNGITTLWCESINGMHDILGQKFAFDGTKLWGESGFFVVQKDSTQTNPYVIGFDGAGMAVAWTEFFTEDSDIYYNYLNANGDNVLGNYGSVLTDAGKSQYEPVGMELNDNAYFIWADGRSSGKTEILGLYAMKVNNQSVSNNDPVVPQAFRPTLRQNYPNPFNPNTSFALDMPESSKIILNIYNTKGQLVKTLFDGSLPRGEHSFDWDGKDQNGNSVASGMYFYTAQNDKGTQSRKMMLMK